MTRAAGILVVAGDKILLARRSQHVNDPGVWSIPGGHLYPGESAMDGAVREFIEEMGSLVPSAPVRTCCYGGYTTIVAAADPRYVRHWVPRLNWENDGVGWFKLNKLPKPLHRGVLRTLGRQHG